MNKTVCVLLSTYNGEKYLREQIESILLQSEVDIRVLARDDCSTDNTVDILKEYSIKDPRFSYYTGNNLGPCQSFFDLVINAGEFDYYAFCDQDDVWDSNKLTIALNKIEERENSIPLLYCSNLRVVDEQLTYMHNCINYRINEGARYQSLIEFYAVGCTEVFNKKAYELLKGHINKKCLMHDSWLFFICSFFGEVIYDDKPHISYRQHGNNVIGTSTGKKKILIERVKRIFNKSIQPRYYNALLFYKEFSHVLNTKDRNKLLEIINYKQNIFKRLVLLFDFSIRAYTIPRDLRYRFLILLGRI